MEKNKIVEKLKEKAKNTNSKQIKESIKKKLEVLEGDKTILK